MSTYMEILFEPGFQWVRYTMELNKVFYTEKVRVVARRTRI